MVRGIGALHNFILKHVDCSGAIKSWLKEVKNDQWNSFHDIKKKYASASNLGEKVVVFNIKGNCYRLEVKVNYQLGVVLIKRIGTHDEYLRWNL